MSINALNQFTKCLGLISYLHQYVRLVKKSDVHIILENQYDFLSSNYFGNLLEIYAYTITKAVSHDTIRTYKKARRVFHLSGLKSN